LLLREGAVRGDEPELNGFNRHLHLPDSRGVPSQCDDNTLLLLRPGHVTVAVTFKSVAAQVLQRGFQLPGQWEFFSTPTPTSLFSVCCSRPDLPLSRGSAYLPCLDRPCAIRGHGERAQSPGTRPDHEHHALTRAFRDGNQYGSPSGFSGYGRHVRG
jgi:hypothetical protein